MGSVPRSFGLESNKSNSMCYHKGEAGASKGLFGMPSFAEMFERRWTAESTEAFGSIRSRVLSDFVNASFPSDSNS